jgi:hypothetical protein
MASMWLDLPSFRVRLRRPLVRSIAEASSLHAVHREREFASSIAPGVIGG